MVEFNTFRPEADSLFLLPRLTTFTAPPSDPSARYDSDAEKATAVMGLLFSEKSCRINLFDTAKHSSGRRDSLLQERLTSTLVGRPNFHTFAAKSSPPVANTNPVFGPIARDRVLPS